MTISLARRASAEAAGTGALVAAVVGFGISGAYLSPVVTLVEAARGALGAAAAVAYVGSQIAGALGGVVVAHAMFGLPALTASAHTRSGPSQLLSEVVATLGLLLVIASCSRHRPAAVPAAVAAYITAAYWFTASTSFANPAVTLARAATDTFAGIRPADVPGFLGAQLGAAGIAAGIVRWAQGRGGDA